MDNPKQWLNEKLTEGVINLYCVEKRDTDGNSVYMKGEDEEWSKRHVVTLSSDRTVFIQKSLLHEDYLRWYDEKRRLKQVRGTRENNTKFWQTLKQFLPETSKSRIGVQKFSKVTIPFSAANKDRFRDAIGHANWTFGDNHE